MRGNVKKVNSGKGVGTRQQRIVDQEVQILRAVSWSELEETTERTE